MGNHRGSIPPPSDNNYIFVEEYIMKWFTSDLHLGHENLLNKGYRGNYFCSIQEHDEIILNNLLNSLKSGDNLYLLGDIFWKNEYPTMKKLFIFLEKNNIKYYYIRGNHEPKNLIVDPLNQYETLSVHTEKGLLFLCHYPMLTWNQSHRNSIQLHGHIHMNDSTYCKLRTNRNILPPGKRINVNVEFWNFYPVSLPQIIEKANTLPDNWDCIK